MLSLKLGLSLSTLRPQGVWAPDDEASLEAWYKKGVGITLNGSDVSIWSDSSSNSNDMRQSDTTEQPAYSSGVLTFDGTGENLQTSGQVSLSGDFTVGIKLTPTTPFGTVLGDNTATGEWMRIINSDTLRIKIDNAPVVDLALDSGSWAEGTIVLTRNSNTISMWYKGVLQADTEILSGTADIDAIGVRKTDLNPFNGTIEEVQIYSSYSTDLTANVNAWLLSL